MLKDMLNQWQKSGIRPQGLKDQFAQDPVEEEQEAQRQEFLKRQGEDTKVKHLTKVSQVPKKKPKVLTSEELVVLTSKWLEQTFPNLFARTPCLPLDANVLRDLKNFYRHHKEKRRFPDNLMIKTALNQHKQSRGYLECLQEGEPKYSLMEKVTDVVSKEEAMLAKKQLEDLVSECAS